MAEYRFYFSDKNAHILGPAMEFDLNDDQAAISKAVVLGRKPALGGTHVEAWDRGRLVARVRTERS